MSAADKTKLEGSAGTVPASLSTWIVLNAVYTLLGALLSSTLLPVNAASSPV